VMAVGDLSEAIETIKAYEAAGVDAIWLTHPHRAGLETLHGATKIPLVVGVSFFQHQSHTDPDVDRFLWENGARVVSLGSAHFTAAVKAAHETLKALADGTKTYAELEQAQDTKQLMAQLTRLDETNDAIERFLN
jgi:2-methylisocitrate lyase-like PEP mutase family enzyme